MRFLSQFSVFFFFPFFLFRRAGCIAWDDASRFSTDGLGLILVQTEKVHISPILAQNYELTRQPGLPGVALLNPFFIGFIHPRQRTENCPMPTANFVLESEVGYRVRYKSSDTAL
jgi:hypothetical protein